MSAPKKHLPRPPQKIGPRRFALSLEFDGTSFRGWQRQGETGLKTVQGLLLRRAAELFGTTGLDLQGNGRTDAGVHALDYTAHLDLTTDLAPEAIRTALNQALPRDLVVRALWPVDPRFHARHHCQGRSYLYQIALEPSAFSGRYSWALADGLDLRRLDETAPIFEGMHDFAAFAEKQELKKSTQVLVKAVRLGQVGGLLLIRVVGSHFLWHQVRRMVGTLAAIGSGKLNIDQARAMLHSGENLSIPWLAPAQGLFFEKAFYEQGEYATFADTAPLLPAPRCFTAHAQDA